MLSEKQLFLKSLELPEEERDGFLYSECSGNNELIDRVQKLLCAHKSSTDFLESLPDDDSNRLAERLRSAAPSNGFPGQQLGRYRLLEMVGEGAWGTVWMAQQTEDVDRRVAIKILKEGRGTKDFLARFEAERQMLALMDHPNIARVIDAGATESGRPYLVMELVQGIQILEFANKNRLGIRERVSLFVKVCRAVYHAHRKGVVHRDLKPSNILVSSQYGEALPKVIDFGVAKSSQSLLEDEALCTSMHTFIGTPVYSSPEQLEFAGLEVDSHSDIYSLGALLYELLSGATPYECQAQPGQGLAEFVRQVKEDGAPRPSRRFDRLSSEEKERIASYRGTTPSKLESLLADDLDWIILKCLEKEPSSRYESAAALADDLQAFLDNRTVSATRPNTIKWIRRLVTKKRPAYAIWLEAAAALTVIWAIVFYWRAPPSSQSPYFDSSIAVLPLENLSPDPENAYLAEGIREDLLSDLSKIRELLVKTGSSTDRYREKSMSRRDIGKELDARYLIEGSVRRIGDQVRVTVQLVDTEAERHLWSESYSRNIDNVFRIQDLIAKEIAGQIELTLSPDEIANIDSLPTKNREAYELYLRSRIPEFYDKIGLLERAVELDPEFSDAWAELALRRIVRWRFDTRRSDQSLLASAHHAMDQALKIRPDSPKVLFVQSNMVINERLDYELSIDYLLKALEADPNYGDAKKALGLRYSVLGRLAESQFHFEASLKSDPFRRVSNWWLIDVYHARNFWREARSLIKRNKARFDEDGFWSRYESWSEYLENGDRTNYVSAIYDNSGFHTSKWVRAHNLIVDRQFQSALEALEAVDPASAWDEYYANSGDLYFFWDWEIMPALIEYMLGDRERWLIESSKALKYINDGIARDPLSGPLSGSKLAICYALQGDRASTEKTIIKVRDESLGDQWRYRWRAECEIRVAMAYLILGEDDKALEILEAASKMEGPLPFSRQLDLWFIFDRLRGNPRLDALLADALR